MPHDADKLYHLYVFFFFALINFKLGGNYGHVSIAVAAKP